MKVFGKTLPIVTFITISFLPLQGYSQPHIPREKIPTNIPADVRKEIGKLYSSDPVKRGHAALGLGLKKEKAAPAIPFLVEMLSDWTALQWRKSSSIYGKYTTPGKEAAKALTRIGKPAIQPLLEALNHSDYGVRENASWALGEMKEHSVVEPLIEIIGRNEYIGVRESVAEALGKIGDRRASKSLISALEDKDVSVRIYAAEALGKIKDDYAVESLIGALSVGRMGGWGWNVRKNAAWALGEIKDHRAVEPLIASLKDKDERVKYAAAMALGKLKNSRAVEPLISALRDKDFDRFVAWALGEIKDYRAVEPLIASLKDDRHRYPEEFTAREALKNITGKNFGRDSVKWQEWWEQNKEKYTNGR